MIIGLTGPLAAGKNTIIAALKQKGFESITMSDVIRAEAGRLGVDIAERSKMQDFANSVRAKDGSGAWAKRCLTHIKAAGGDLWIVDGIRNPIEIEELRKEPAFVLVAVLLSEQESLKRILGRKRDIDPTDPEEVRKRLRRDWGIGEPPEGQQVGQCIRLADYFFDNTIQFENVEPEFLKLYDRICKEKNFNL